MTTPTSWNDKMNWPVVGQFRVLTALEAIRLAIVERIGAARVSEFEMFHYSGLANAFAAGRVVRGAMDASIQTAMTNLIPRFVNHTDNAGDWDGVASIPAWTESAILAALGDPARLTMPGPGRRMGAWLYQQYRMLNLLRWTVPSVSIETLSTGSLFAGYPGDTGANLAWASVLSTGYPYPPVASGVALAYVQDSGASVGAGRAKQSVDTGAFALSCAADVYAYVDTFGAFGFDAQGLGYAEDAYTLLDSLAPATAHTHTLAPPDSPRPALDTGWQGNLTLVCKFDVPGGFTFID